MVDFNWIDCDFLLLNKSLSTLGLQDVGIERFGVIKSSFRGLKNLKSDTMVVSMGSECILFFILEWIFTLFKFISLLIDGSAYGFLVFVLDWTVLLTIKFDKLRKFLTYFMKTSF